MLVINRVRVLGRGPHTPTQFFRGGGNILKCGQEILVMDVLYKM